MITKRTAEQKLTATPFNTRSFPSPAPLREREQLEEPELRKRRLFPSLCLCYTGRVMASANDELAEIPLFPLNLVLFPGMPLPLHIFEERYKAMIGECLRNNTPFGVSLIRSGPEVGAAAEPQRIGTTTRVLRSQLLEQGRMNIITKGERRFEIIETTQQEPHVAALVRLLDEPVGDGFTGVSSELTEEFTKLMRSLVTLTGGYTSQVDVPEDPVELSYMIAANLDAPIPVRQELLEVPTAADRLNRLIPLLKRRNHALQEEITKQNPFRGPRLN